MRLFFLTVFTSHIFVAIRLCNIILFNLGKYLVLCIINVGALIYTLNECLRFLAKLLQIVSLILDI